MDALTSAPVILLDSWPILEWLKGREPGARAFSQLIDAAFANEVSFAMSRMNYGEVLYTIKKDFPGDRVASATQVFLDIPIHFHSVDDLLVDKAAELKARNTISYADSFAAALAMRLNVPLVTGDREFLALQSIGLRLLWVGK